jgi:hypothetical protein
MSKVDPFVDVPCDDELNCVTVLAKQGVQTVIGELGWNDRLQRIMHENERRFVLLELGLEPMQLYFAQRSDARLEIGRRAVLRTAKKIVQVDEFPSFVIQNRVWLGVEFGLE